MDLDGFEEWYLREHPALVNALALVSGSIDEAGEATDEAFARAAARWPRVRAMEHPRAWTYRVALNVLRRNMRRSARRGSTTWAQAAGLELETPTPELWAAVAALPERQRSAVVLRYLADLTEPQVAQIMGISRGTVASTLSRARASLSSTLSDRTHR